MESELSRRMRPRASSKQLARDLFRAVHDARKAAPDPRSVRGVDKAIKPANALLRRVEELADCRLVSPNGGDQWRSAADSANVLAEQLKSALVELTPGIPGLALAEHHLRIAEQRARQLSRRLLQECPKPMDDLPRVGSHQGQGGLRYARPGTYELRNPSATSRVPAGRVTPRVVPASLDVAAPAHGQVRVFGLARFFPAYTVHAQRSSAVVAADNCALQATDHYHVRRVTVSLDALLRPGTPGHTALQTLLRDGPGGIARFQQSLRDIAGPQGRPDSQVRLPVRADHHTSVAGAAVVQAGDGSRMTLSSRYVVEESELPVTDLLGSDKNLVRSFLSAVSEPGRGEGTSEFLRDLLRAVGSTDDLDLLEHAEIGRADSTSIFGLFGVDVVSRASAVMVGSGNRLTTGTQVHRGDLKPGTILDDLDKIRTDPSRVRFTLVDDDGQTASPEIPSPEMPIRSHFDAV